MAYTSPVTKLATKLKQSKADIWEYVNLLPMERGTEPPIRKATRPRASVYSHLLRPGYIFYREYTRSSILELTQSEETFSTRKTPNQMARRCMSCQCNKGTTHIYVHIYRHQFTCFCSTQGIFYKKVNVRLSFPNIPYCLLCQLFFQVWGESKSY